MEGQSTSRRVKRTQRDYSLAFKLQVIYEVEKGELTWKQAQSKKTYTSKADQGTGKEAQTP